MTIAEEHQRRLQELAENAARYKRELCPGVSIDTEGLEGFEPTRFRDDETARRAQALFDLHCGIEPEANPSLAAES